MARLNTQPVIAGFALGAVAGIGLLLLPGTALESIISRTHLADVLTAAQPPLGTKARIMIALIPFVLLSVGGLVLGLLWGGRKRKNEYGEYGAYEPYEDDDRPVADPFATSDMPIMAGTYEADEPARQPVCEPEPIEPPPPPPPTYAPPPVAAPAPALDGATAADLAEIADAVVRLDARLDSIEDKLGGGKAAAKPGDLQKRLGKIAKLLDDAG